jgi:hypothetical protein
MARMKRPNLFILGAPKCGTTALATWLSAHPEVFVSPVKEPHYFCEDHRLTPTLGAYEALFSEADPQRHRWVCEASVWHLFSDTAVPNILRYAPEARFIVMVRSPLDMAPSMHEQHRFNGDELVPDFAEALALDATRNQGNPEGVRPGYPEPRHLAYFRSCALGWQLERLFERVPRERVHVIVFDDLARDASGTHADVLAFLGLPAMPLADAGKVNAAKRRKSFLLDAWVLQLAKVKQRLGIKARFGLLAGIRRWNITPHRRAPLPYPLLRMMGERYAADVALLGRLLGRDLAPWLTTRDS